MLFRKIVKYPIVYIPLDVFFSIFTFFGAAWLRLAKFIGLSKLPVTRKILFKIGVFPIVDNYYEPLFRFDRLSLKDEPRQLAIDWNDDVQLNLVNQFNVKDELDKLPVEPAFQNDLSYYFNNQSYSGYDAEYLYSFIRLMKPKKIIEIGSGFSTRMIMVAIEKNKQENKETVAEIICVEPFEMPWLEQLGPQIIRKKVEDIPISFFQSLEAGDILFIDSSHVIRPEGDVLYEVFNILPHLKPGVYIHIHDIFSPFDYPKNWYLQEYRMWNEQYLLEAFLMHNKQYEVIGALSYLGYKYPHLAQMNFPYSYKNGWKRGSAMWLRKSGLS